MNNYKFPSYPKLKVKFQTRYGTQDLVHSYLNACLDMKVALRGREVEGFHVLFKDTHDTREFESQINNRICEPLTPLRLDPVQVLTKLPTQDGGYLVWGRHL